MTRRPGLRTRRRRVLLALALAGSGLVLVFLSTLIGIPSVSPQLGFQILAHQISGGRLYPSACAGTGLAPSQCPTFTFIVWDIYLPVVLLALVVGAALGLAGASLQGVFRNPLADPFLLGISSGGTLGAALLFVYHVGEANANLYLPLLAFVGSVSTGLVILAVARGRYSSVETLLLTGVALANFLSAMLALVLITNAVAGQQVEFWLLGDLESATWSIDGIAIGGVLIFGTLLCLFGRELNLLQLGSDVAQSAGVDARQVRIRVILLASVVTAIAVAFTGIIGFVGLISPHIVRRLFGNDYRVVLPGSAAVGAVFLLAANDASLLLFPTSLLPIGIFTGFVGVPAFLYLLYRQRRATTMAGG